MQSFSWSDAFNIAMVLVAALGGFFIRAILDRLQRLEESDSLMTKEFYSLREEVAGKYVKQDRLDKSLDAIFDTLRRIEDKVDDKADKPG